MKLLVGVDMLKGELGIGDGLFEGFEGRRRTCVEMLLTVTDKGSKEGWIEEFEVIYSMIKTMSQQCTNMDF